MNSFLALRDQDLDAFTGERRRAVRSRVERNLRTAEFIGSLVELFGPVVGNTLSVLGGGQAAYDGEPVLRTLTQVDDDDPFGSPPAGPTGPGEIVR
ncbi:hypothetical protein [Lewinella sp. IMCC34183]|uniref:hypothetical protein n=1 Tax=Lewinella sp. IMCC34183 TaxID=2248762 RepID=UPI000E26E73F|nr:hypothetical protein [Lewinella sp. IMCC34183]